jgi:glycosyltransferase involved in cell wall biosynthesis
VTPTGPDDERPTAAATTPASGSRSRTEATAAERGSRDAGRPSHVCMLLPGDYPPDVRVRKEADALRAAGHRVTVVCRGPTDRPRRETLDGVRVVRLDRRSRRGRLAEAASAAVNLGTAVHPRWLLALRRVNQVRPIDAVHVHDLPLAGTALAARRLLRVPVVLDCHENYPAAVAQWRRATRRSLRGWLKRRAFPLRRWRALERRWVSRADHVLAVVDEARDHLVDDCGAAPGDVTVVSNTVDLAGFDAADTHLPDDLPRPDPHTFTVGYVGGFGPHRGLDTAVRAVALDDDPDTHLLLVGGGGGTTEADLRDLIAERDVDDRVTITGWVDFAHVPGYVAACDVCLVPHARTEHTETTVPHKLFQYMALRRPVVVSDVAPLARIVRETDAGVVVPADDPAALARAVARLRDDPGERRRLGANGRAAVETRYNWARDAARLRTVYAELFDAEQDAALDEVEDACLTS